MEKTMKNNATVSSYRIGEGRTLQGSFHERQKLSLDALNKLDAYKNKGPLVVRVMWNDATSIQELSNSETNRIAYRSMLNPITSFGKLIGFDDRALTIAQNWDPQKLTGLLTIPIPAVTSISILSCDGRSFECMEHEIQKIIEAKKSAERRLSCITELVLKIFNHGTKRERRTSFAKQISEMIVRFPEDLTACSKATKNQ